MSECEMDLQNALVTLQPMQQVDQDPDSDAFIRRHLVATIDISDIHGSVCKHDYRCITCVPACKCKCKCK